MTPYPPSSVDIIVAEFNELSRQGSSEFDSQMAYLSELSKRHNVILVDDASSDGSWERIVELSGSLNPRLEMMRMETNGRKVLAVMRALEASDADYVLLSDFDSMIANPEDIARVLLRFQDNPSLAGVSLKLVPEGTSLFSKLQDVEYGIMRRIFCKYLSSQGKLRCVPGAAGIWDRKVLLETMKEHSGRHNGDDLESTAIALKNGYVTEYAAEVQVRTIVPQTPKALYVQRKRWELGSLETYDKERGFFAAQAKNAHSRLGHVTLLDWYYWATAILTPVFLLNMVFNPHLFLSYMALEFSLESVMGVLSRNEFRTKKELLLLPLFPFYRILILMPRLAAGYQFLARIRRHAPPPSPLRLQTSPLARSLSRHYVPLPVAVVIE